MSSRAFFLTRPSKSVNLACKVNLRPWARSSSMPSGCTPESCRVVPEAMRISSVFFPSSLKVMTEGTTAWTSAGQKAGRPATWAYSIGASGAGGAGGGTETPGVGAAGLPPATGALTGAGGGTNSGSSTTGGWASTRVVTPAGALVTTMEKVGCRNSTAAAPAAPPTRKAAKRRMKGSMFRSRP